MLNADDLAKMQNDLTTIRLDRDESVTIRRGSTSLSAQTVRIALAGLGRRLDKDTGMESRGRITMLMAQGADVQVDDRFNDSNGVLYRVIFVRPNRDVATMVQAEVVE